MTQNTHPVDPALTGHLEELVDLANEIGAQGIWIIRGAKNASLSYEVDNLEQPNIPDFDASLNTSIIMRIADSGLFVLMRFPASDGGEPGIEVK